MFILNAFKTVTDAVEDAEKLSVHHCKLSSQKSLNAFNVQGVVHVHSAQRAVLNGV